MVDILGVDIVGLRNPAQKKIAEALLNRNSAMLDTTGEKYSEALSVAQKVVYACKNRTQLNTVQSNLKRFRILTPILEEEIANQEKGFEENQREGQQFKDGSPVDFLLMSGSPSSQASHPASSPRAPSSRPQPSRPPLTRSAWDLEKAARAITYNSPPLSKPIHGINYEEADRIYEKVMDFRGRSETRYLDRQSYLLRRYDISTPSGKVAYNWLKSQIEDPSVLCDWTALLPPHTGGPMMASCEPIPIDLVKRNLGFLGVVIPAEDQQRAIKGLEEYYNNLYRYPRIPSADPAYTPLSPLEQETIASLCSQNFLAEDYLSKEEQFKVIHRLAPEFPDCIEKAMEKNPSQTKANLEALGWEATVQMTKLIEESRPIVFDKTDVKSPPRSAIERTAELLSSYDLSSPAASADYRKLSSLHPDALLDLSKPENYQALQKYQGPHSGGKFQHNIKAPGGPDSPKETSRGQDGTPQVGGFRVEWVDRSQPVSPNSAPGSIKIGRSPGCTSI